MIWLFGLALTPSITRSQQSNDVNAMNLKTGQVVTLKINGKSNCLNMLDKNIESFAKIQIPPGLYEVTLNSKAYGITSKSGSVPDVSTIIKKAVVYMINPSKEYVWIIEDNQPLRIRNAGQGLMGGNTLFAFFLDVYSADNNGDGVLSIKKIE